MERQKFNDDGSDNSGEDQVMAYGQEQEDPNQYQMDDFGDEEDDYGDYDQHQQQP